MRARGDGVLKIVRTLGVATSVVAKGRLADLMAMLNNRLRTERVGMPAMLGLRVSLLRAASSSRIGFSGHSRTCTTKASG
jgi:hypothetical protein